VDSARMTFNIFCFMLNEPCQIFCEQVKCDLSSIACVYYIQTLSFVLAMRLCACCPVCSGKMSTLFGWGSGDIYRFFGVEYHLLLAGMNKSFDLTKPWFIISFVLVKMLLFYLQADLARTTQYSREHFSKGKTTLSSFEAQLMQAVQPGHQFYLYSYGFYSL
jgi:hypothetical protein